MKPFKNYEINTFIRYIFIYALYIFYTFIKFLGNIPK